MRRVAACAQKVFSWPRYILVWMWNGSNDSSTTPYFLQTSTADFNSVPAPSMKVSGRWKNASVSLEAIHTNRGETRRSLFSLLAVTKW